MEVEGKRYAEKEWRQSVEAEGSIYAEKVETVIVVEVTKYRDESCTEGCHKD